jgi:hypothetical protein
MTFLKYRARFGSDPKWKEYLDVYDKGLALWAQGIRLSPKLVKNPNLIADEWPTPGRMIYGNKGRGQPPFLRGPRRAVFKNLYDSHYGHQSEQAHQRAAAVGAALLVDDPEAQWNPGLGESRLIADALLFLTCILSELESKGKYPAHPRLRELWVYLCALGDDAKELWQLRYQKLANA